MLPQRDIVAYWNGLTKVEFWHLSQGDVQNLMDEAVEEIERLRAQLSNVGNEAPPAGVEPA